MSIGKAQSGDEKVKDQQVAPSSQSLDDWGFGKRVKSLSREAKWAAAGIAVILLAFATVVWLRWKMHSSLEPAAADLQQRQMASDTPASKSAVASEAPNSAFAPPFSSTTGSSRAADSFDTAHSPGAGQSVDNQSMGMARVADQNFLSEQTEPPPISETPQKSMARSNAGGAMTWPPSSEKTHAGSTEIGGFAPRANKLAKPGSDEPFAAPTKPGFSPAESITSSNLPAEAASLASGTQAVPGTAQLANSKPSPPNTLPFDEPRTSPAAQPPLANTSSLAPSSAGSSAPTSAPPSQSGQPDAGVHSNTLETSRPILLVDAKETDENQNGESTTTSPSVVNTAEPLQVARAPALSNQEELSDGERSAGRKPKGSKGKHSQIGRKRQSGHGLGRSDSAKPWPASGQNAEKSHQGEGLSASTHSATERPLDAASWPVGADPFDAAQSETPTSRQRPQDHGSNELGWPSTTTPGNASQSIPSNTDPFGPPPNQSSNLASSKPLAPGSEAAEQAPAAARSVTSVTKNAQSEPLVRNIPQDFGSAKNFGAASEADGFLPPKSLTGKARGEAAAHRADAGQADGRLESLPPRPSPVEPSPRPLFGNRTSAPAQTEPPEAGEVDQPTVNPARPLVRLPGHGIDEKSGAPEAGSTSPFPFQARVSDTESSPTGPAPSHGTKLKSGLPQSGSFTSSADDFHLPVGPSRPQTYVVQENDSFWTISKKVYGTARYFQALALYNKSRVPDPRRMRPGTIIQVPPPQVLEKRFPELVAHASAKPEKHPSRSTSIDADRKQPSGLFVGPNGEPLYRVGEKDTLSDIAYRHLGRASRWIQIFELNRDKLQNPNDLKIGTVLRLPRDARAARVSEARRTSR